MKKILARFNCGQWLWDCPTCSAGNKIEPGQTMAFCGDCYRDKFAIKRAVINGVIVEGVDKTKQDAAKEQAWAENKVYKISFPRDYRKITDALRGRRAEHMSWEPGETVEDILAENESHPALRYLEKKKVPKKRAEEKKPPARASLDEKTLRRIA